MSSEGINRRCTLLLLILTICTSFVLKHLHNAPKLFHFLVRTHDNFIEIKGIIEKPNLADAPSDIAVCGRYILNSSIFNYLEETIEDLSNEIQLTDAIKLMLNDEKVLACVYEGEKFDCGSKQGFVEATIAISLRDEEIKDDITKYIKQLST